MCTNKYTIVSVIFYYNYKMTVIARFWRFFHSIEYIRCFVYYIFIYLEKWNQHVWILHVKYKSIEDKEYDIHQWDHLSGMLFVIFFPFVLVTNVLVEKKLRYMFL